jgi:phytoene dehydrogenase-like protein
VRTAHDVSYDAIIVGAGHNGLVAAAYLAQAGTACACSSAARVGGAVATEEIVPGYRFDLGGSAHILIRLTPVVEELGLGAFGLEYLELDPLFFAPFEDGDRSSSTATLERARPSTSSGGSRARATAYRRFCDAGAPSRGWCATRSSTTPGPLQLGRRFVFNRGMRSDWQRALRRDPAAVRRGGGRYFREEKVKAPLVWMAAQSGPPPFEPLTAPFLLWQPLYHEGGIARPRGGSGMLTQALRATSRRTAARSTWARPWTRSW